MQSRACTCVPPVPRSLTARISILSVFVITLFISWTKFYDPSTESVTEKTCSPLVILPSPVKYDICIITRLKNYAEWIPEWIEHHHLLGVQRFFIADDCSDDNGATEAVLDFYSTLGFVEVFKNVPTYPCNTPDRQPREEKLISFVFHKAKEAQCDWIGMIDVDEYVTLLDGIEKKYSLLEVLRAALLPYAKLGWWTVGSDGHETKPTHLLTSEAYRKGIFEDYHSKMFARAAAVREWQTSIFPDGLTTGLDCLTTDALRLKVERFETRYVTVDGKTQPVPIAPIVLKHYVYRSWEEYMRSRGSITKTSNSDINPWYNNKERWTRGNFDTFELAPEFTANLTKYVRQVLLQRRLPKIPHFTILETQPKLG